MNTFIETHNPLINDGLAIEPSQAENIDIANGNSYAWSQLTTLIVHNTDANPLDIRIQSLTDTAGKSKTIELVAIAENSYAIVNFLDSDFPINGEISITYNHATGTSTTGKIIPVSLSKP